jgi:UDP-glucuronate decarboxylase
MKRKIIVTGGTGFIGRNLLPFLEKLDADVFLLTRNDDFLSGHGNISTVNCDLHDQKAVRKILKSLKASHLMHLAWGMAPSSYNLPLNLDWLKSSMFLLDEFQKNQGKRAILVGSCLEYNLNYGSLHEETTPLSHSTLYGSAKNILRHYAFSLCHHHEIEIVWPRLFFLYGPHENRQRLIAQVILSLLRGEKISIRNGEIYRDYMYAKDCAEALSMLIFNEFTGVINISTGIPARLGDMGHIIAEIIGRPELLNIESPENGKDQVFYGYPEKLKENLSFTPSYDLKTGLRETIEWWKENRQIQEPVLSRPPGVKIVNNQQYEDEKGNFPKKMKMK